MLFEAIGKDGKVIFSDPTGRFINPGHAFESAWMGLNALDEKNDPMRRNRVYEIIDWVMEKGWDAQYSGMFAYLDAEGGEPVPLDWHKETGSVWDEKTFWVIVEPLRGLAATYKYFGNQKYFDRFETLHRFCERYFHDAEYGERYERLNRDGTVKCSDKGTRSKCAGHVQRSINAIIRMFESMNE